MGISVSVSLIVLDLEPCKTVRETCLPTLVGNVKPTSKHFQGSVKMGSPSKTHYSQQNKLIINYFPVLVIYI